MRKSKLFLSKSSKPCVVEYCIKRLQIILGDAMSFAQAIDPAALPDRHEEMTKAIGSAIDIVASLKVPNKKSRMTEAQRQEVIAKREAIRLEKVAAREAQRNEKIAAREAAHKEKLAARDAARLAKLAARSEARPAKPIGPVLGDLSKPKIAVGKKPETGVVPGSAIERALAAARARREAKRKAA